MQYPLQSDEYDVDVFNDNFKELDKKIDNNFETMSNNMAEKADVSDVEEETSDIREYIDEVESELNTKINGKAASSHNHAASNITSGVLSVERGGTGQSSFAENGILVGNSKGGITQLNKAPGMGYFLFSSNSSGNINWIQAATQIKSGSSEPVTSGIAYKAIQSAIQSAIDKSKKIFKIGEDFTTFSQCEKYVREKGLYGCTVYLSVKDIPETGISFSGGWITCLDFGFNNNDVNKYDESWENTDVFAITASNCTIKNLLFNSEKSENPYKYIKLGHNCKIDNVIINKTDDAGSGKTYSVEGSGIIECSESVGSISITNCILQNVNININDTYQLNPNNGYFFVSNNVINKLTVNTGSKQLVGNPLVCVVNNIFGEEPSITTASGWGKQFINNNVVIG